MYTCIHKYIYYIYIYVPLMHCCCAPYICLCLVATQRLSKKMLHHPASELPQQTQAEHRMYFSYTPLSPPLQC